jgi:RNA polymerase sigma-70 factor (ECF subfamily)
MSCGRDGENTVEPDWTLDAIPMRIPMRIINARTEIPASSAPPARSRGKRPAAGKDSRQSRQVQLLERPTHRSYGCVPTGSVARARRTETGELPEAEAIRLAQQGDAAAFDTAEAEDLTQEAFLQLFRKIATFRGESAFSTWLHRLAVNVVLMKLRKKSGTETSLEEVTEPDEESGGPRRDFGSPDLRLMGSIDRVNLQRAVERLPPGYKSVFVLHDVQGYEHNEIAEIMECSIGNSKSQLHKARMRLRELLHEVLRDKARDERKAASDAVGEE